MELFMKRLKNKLKNKLKNHSGETIGEVLVALLISALALMMLAGAITTSSRLVTTSRDRQKDYYKANDALNGRSGTSGSGSEGTVILKEGTAEIKSSTVNFYINNTFTKTPVIAYSLQDDT